MSDPGPYDPFVFWESIFHVTDFENSSCVFCPENDFRKQFDSSTYYAHELLGSDHK